MIEFPFTAIVLNFVIQLGCSTITVILDPMTLYSQFKHKRHDTQLSMLLSHISVQFCFGVANVVYNSCSLYQSFTSDKNHSVMFWTGAFSMGLLIAAGISNFFLALDRTLAFNYPVKYLKFVQHRMTVASMLSCVVATVVILSLMQLHQSEPPIDGVLLAEHVNPSLVTMLLAGNNGLAIFDLCITVILVYKLKKYNRTIRTGVPRGVSAKKANSTVLIQMLLAMTFWIAPHSVNTALNHCGINAFRVLGQYTTTLLVVYIMTCSILYRWQLKVNVDGRISDCNNK